MKNEKTSAKRNEWTSPAIAKLAARVMAIDLNEEIQSADFHGGDELYIIAIDTKKQFILTSRIGVTVRDLKSLAASALTQAPSGKK